MAFRDRNLSFEEADRRYAELVQKRRSGSVNDREFDAERQRLMVRDQQGRWWAKSAATGEWNYHDGKAWVRGVPPAYRSSAAQTSAEGAPGARAESRRSDSPYSGSPAQEVADGEQRSSRASWLGLSVLGALLLLGLLGWGAYTMTRGTAETAGTVKEVKVPDLDGAASLAEARRAAGGDFEVVEGEKVESQKPIGAIVGQDPAAGKLVEPSSSIRVNLSKGVNLPDVKGEKREEAVRILSEKGFQIEGKFAESSADDEDRVIGQDPKGGNGESVEAGTSVVLTVGTGPPDPKADTSTDTNPAADQSSPGPSQEPSPGVVGTPSEPSPGAPSPTSPETWTPQPWTPDPSSPAPSSPDPSSPDPSSPAPSSAEASPGPAS